MNEKTKYSIQYKFGIYSIIDENNNILANYKDLNTAQNHLGVL